MTSKPETPGKTASIEQQLRDENAALRAKMAKIQRNLEAQKYRRRELSKMLKVGFWEWDEIAGKPVSYSVEMADVLGLDLAILEKIFHRPETFKRFLHPEDQQLYQDKIDSRTQLSPGLPRVHDYRVLVDDHETRYIREYEQGVFDDGGRLIASFGMVQDVTSTRVTLDALKASEKRYHSLFEQMPLGVQEEDYSPVKKVVDKLNSKGVEDLEAYFLEHPKVLRELIGHTRVTNVNETLLRMHEAESREEFLLAEADLDDWWDEQWVQYYAAEIAALASNAHYYEAERIDTRMDDEAFETRAIVTLVRGYEDTWERVITIHEDVSNRKQTESAMREAMVQAEKANQAKSDFLSSMSHELRTPLNAILGYSQLFAYDRNLGEQHLANANEINRAGKHLMSLIDQILDLSRIEAGESDVALEPVKLKRVLSDSVKWAKPLAQERSIEIGFNASEFDGVNVVADSIRLKQVFLNLLTNAVKYNRTGGSVNVICDSAGDGDLRVGVRDTGRGISAEKLKELFQPFNRLGAEFSGIEGSGIGLVISRQLVDLMQGDLQIDSEPDVGSTFWVSLKLAPAQASVMDTQILEIPDALREVITGEAARILVVEDNTINQELMEAQLDVLGYSADYADNGKQALEKWRHGNYKLLLTDIRMPEMDGYELVGQIRVLEEGSGKRIPVIAITANAHASDVQKCYEAGVDDVIPKPVELEDLRSALGKWIAAESSQAVSAKAADIADDAPAEAIDLEVLIQSTGDKPELHRNLLKSYFESLERELDHVRQAFAWKNSEQVVEYSHRLKGSSRSLGIVGMAQICDRLETAAKSDSWTKLDELMPVLQRSAAEAKRSIGDFLAAEVETPEPEKPFTTEIDLVLGEVEDVTQFSIKLMLVDDDYIMHRVTTVILNDLGVSNVISAMSGPAALDILDAQGDSVDVVICDLNMPKMDGVEFIRHLAQRGYDGALIITSGEDMRILKTVEKLAIEHDLQILGVLEKPVTPIKIGELLDALDQVQEEGTMMLFDAIVPPELEAAIDNDELDTYFQPKVEIESGRVMGIEALVRWHHPAKGLIKPDAFIPLAEEHGLISKLSDEVCVKAMEYAARLKALEHNLNIAINLSVDTLTDLGWPEKISETLQKYGLEPSSISFEITESRLMEHLSVALDILSRLSLKRFNLSIDDFGTGYSSMEQLQRIPFSEFKIDRAFVHGAAREASAQAILESSILLARKLNMKVVAEGVETQEDWDLVARLGCDQVQGYFVAKPMPFAHLLKWLQDSEAQKKLRRRA